MAASIRQSATWSEAGHTAGPGNRIGGGNGASTARDATARQNGE